MNTSHPIIDAKKLNRDLDILCVAFNQDQGCFAVGHERGFVVYNTNPIDLRVKRNFGGGGSTSNDKNKYNVTSSHSTSASGGSGIGHICMLHRTNYLALVGGGRNPKFASNNVVIWDDLKRKNSLSLEFMVPVMNVFLLRIRIIVVLRNQVIVYGFSAPPKQIVEYETLDNEHGIADLSASILSTGTSILPTGSVKSGNENETLSSSSPFGETAKYQTLAFPGKTIGQIQIVDVSPAGQNKNMVSIIKAHKSKIRAISLSRSGTLVASASETGTIIRIHSTQSTALLYEFRRGIDRAIITSMKFSPNDSRLAVLSDKNTLHVFTMQDPTRYNESNNSGIGSAYSNTNDPKSLPTNKQHILRKLQLPIPIPRYFQSTWSFCSINTNKYHHNEDDELNSHDLGTLGWSGNDTVVIIWKKKRIWEKYTIREQIPSGHTSDRVSNGSHNRQMSSEYFDGYSQSKHTNWEIVRTGWKKLLELGE
ncbi:Phosphatidylinositol 3,5-bisphosphate-binding protein [Scheffersomyces spartinae]|uniref:Phosphatidylinositol 3,5-bisphosphate-binding protein n=1 Tax=Scheffersomyces spartinae TaxID=45513 RepID=A0A9P7VCH8_9ASCO|nr:Phosphatidylinositol 3,5-bisphosphate-binding protein [Scheffersomyces spartinae]KAG7195190.1 Phosphatidylinositol 3,5-bisphosphate-binding protein [Scheffersomyces spartinae]